MSKIRRGEKRPPGIRVWQAMMEGHILLTAQHQKLIQQIQTHEFRDCVHIGKLFHAFYVGKKSDTLAVRFRARTVALKSVLQTLNLMSIEKGIVHHDPK